MIQIPGLKRALFPHQAYAVFWMLLNEHIEAGKGFLMMEWVLKSKCENFDYHKSIKRLLFSEHDSIDKYNCGSTRSRALEIFLFNILLLVHKIELVE